MIYRTTRVWCFGKGVCRQRRHKSYFLLALILIAHSFLAILQTHPASASACSDVEFIFARGSGESLNGPSHTAWTNSITEQLKSFNLTTSFYELGSDPGSPYQYPAAPVSNSFVGYVNLISAAISGGEAFLFGASVNQGRQELIYHIEQVNNRCSHTKFVIGGYSQGAMLIDKALPSIDSEKILYVATFGDPKLYLPEGAITFKHGMPVPDACYGVNLSPYRVYVPDCRAYEGVLGATRPYQPIGYEGKLGTWCNDYDIMCSSGMSINDHVGYTTKDLYKQAASKISSVLSTKYSDHLVTSRATISGVSKHDVVFLLDVSGSMQTLYGLYAGKLRVLANAVKLNGGRISLYYYANEAHGYYPIEKCDLTCDFATIEQLIDPANVDRHSNGNYNKESTFAAMKFAINNTKWDTGARKTLVNFSSHPPLSPDADGTTAEDVIALSQAKGGIELYSVNYSDVQMYLEGLAYNTNGGAYDFRNTTAKFVRDVINNTPTIDQVPPRVTAAAKAAKTAKVATSTTDSDSSTNPSTLDNLVYVDDEYPYTPEAKITTHSTTLQSDQSVKVEFSTDAEHILVAFNDAPMGFIEPVSGQGDFTITDITDDIEVALIPYSANEQRGITARFTVQKTQDPTGGSGGGSGNTGDDNKDPDNPNNPNDSGQTSGNQNQGDNNPNIPSNNPQGDQGSQGNQSSSDNQGNQGGQNNPGNQGGQTNPGHTGSNPPATGESNQPTTPSINQSNSVKDHNSPSSIGDVPPYHVPKAPDTGAYSRKLAQKLKK